MLENVSWEKHLPRLFEIGGEVFREANKANKNSDPGTIVEAKALSLNCAECGGEGLTHRYRHRPKGDGKGCDSVDAMTICYCNLCPMGRAVALNHKKHCPEMYGRTIDLNQTAWASLRLRSCDGGIQDNPHRHKAENWDYAFDGPMPPERDPENEKAFPNLMQMKREVLPRVAAY